MARTADKAQYFPHLFFLMLGIIWGSNFIYMKLGVFLLKKR